MPSVFQKLNLKDEPEVVVLNAPPSFDKELATITGAKVVRAVPRTKSVRFAIAFATTQREVDAAAASLTSRADGDLKLWIAYPKQSSKRYQCDFNRDTGWAALGEAGYEPVRMVAIDEDWSALRFRRAEMIKGWKRAPEHAISAVGKARAAKKR